MVSILKEGYDELTKWSASPWRPVYEKKPEDYLAASFGYISHGFAKAKASLEAEQANAEEQREGQPEQLTFFNDH